MLTTISDYLNNGKHIYGSILIPSYDYFSADVITALDIILKTRYGAVTMISDNESEIQAITLNMVSLYDKKYTALYNVNGVIDPAIEFSETVKNSGTQTNKNTGTQTNANTGTQTNANTGTQTNANTGTQTNANTGTQTNEDTPTVTTTVTENKNTADNGTLRVVGSQVTGYTGKDTNVRTDALTATRTDDLTATRTDDLTATRTDNLTATRTDDLTATRTDNLKTERDGFNNKFANAENILNLCRTQLYDMIIKDTLDHIALNIYDNEDLRL